MATKRISSTGKITDRRLLQLAQSGGLTDLSGKNLAVIDNKTGQAFKTGSSSANKISRSSAPSVGATKRQFTPGGNAILSDEERRVQALLRASERGNKGAVQALQSIDKELLSRFTPGGELIVDDESRKFQAALKATEKGGRPDAADTARRLDISRTGGTVGAFTGGTGGTIPARSSGATSQSREDQLAEELARVQAENAALKKHDETVASQIAGGALTFGKVESGTGAEIGGADGGFQQEPERQIADIDAITKAIEEEQAAADQREREELERKLGIRRQEAQDAIRKAEEQAAKDQQAAVGRFFGGQEGVFTSTGAQLPEVIKNAGMENVVKLKEALDNFDIEAENLLLDLDEAQKKEIRQLVADQVSAFNEAEDLKIKDFRERQDRKFDQLKFQYEVLNDKRTADRLERAQNLADRKFEQEVVKFMGDEAKDLMDKFGKNVASGVLAEYYNEIGIEVSEELLSAETKQDKIDAIMNDSKMAKAFSDLDPSARQYMIGLMDAEDQAKFTALHEGLVQEAIQAQLDELKIFEEKERIKKSFQKRSGGGGGGGSYTALEKSFFNNALANNITPLEFSLSIATSQFTASKRDAAVEAYTEMWNNKKSMLQIVESGAEGPLPVGLRIEDFNAMQRAEERDQLFIQRGFRPETASERSDREDRERLSTINSSAQPEGDDEEESLQEIRNLAIQFDNSPE